MEIYKVYKKTKQNIWEVSNYGNVKKNGELYKCGMSSGYKRFCGSILLHRAVAELFVLNTDPESKNVVDHIDTNKLNNHFTNLKWCTQKENQNNELTLKHIKIVQNQPEVKRKISEAHKGKTFSEEHRQKLSEAQKIAQNRHEVRQKKSEANKGRTFTEEWKQKISKALKGKKLSDEQKQKISKGNKGKTRSEEAKQKISKALKGKKHSPSNTAVCIYNNIVFNTIKDAYEYAVANNLFNKSCSSFYRINKMK